MTLSYSVIMDVAKSQGGDGIDVRACVHPTATGHSAKDEGFAKNSGQLSKVMSLKLTVDEQQCGGEANRS